MHPKKIWKNLGITSKGLLAVSVPLIVLLLSITYLYQRELAAQSVEGDLQNAMVELAKIQGIHAQLAEAATGVRGFLITGRDDFLTRYYKSRERLPIEIAQLRQTLNDTELLNHLSIMEPLVNQKLDGMKKLLAEGPLMSKNELINILVSQKLILDNIRDRIDLMRERESVLIKQKQTALQNVRKSNLHLTIFAALIGIISALFAINFYFADIVKRILQLRDNAALLAKGVPIKAAKKTADEIGVLSESLERASQLIASKQQETELARAEAEAANAAKTQFLSRTSHELRTPLNAILGFAQILKSDLPNGSLKQSASHIEAAGNHLLKLINDVLNISRIESGEAGIHISTYDVHAILYEAITLFEQAALQKNISLQANLPNALYVLADRDKVLQILINLISNAIKYGPSDSSVTIWSEKKGAQIHIYIKDQGVGIPENLRSRLFTPFDRLGAEKLTIEGVGLGLALSKELALAMNGNLVLGNESSVFELTLPISTDIAEMPTSQPTVKHAAFSPSKKQHILYVEDNASNIALVQTLLRREKTIDLHTASTVRDALSFINAHTVDLVLLDIHLPDEPGDQFLLALRAMPKYEKTPIIVLSADVLASSVDRIKNLGANEYLYKPIDIHLLSQRIRAYLT